MYYILIFCTFWKYSPYNMCYINISIPTQVLFWKNIQDYIGFTVYSWGKTVFNSRTIHIWRNIDSNVQWCILTSKPFGNRRNFTSLRRASVTQQFALEVVPVEWKEKTSQNSTQMYEQEIYREWLSSVHKIHDGVANQ